MEGISQEAIAIAGHMKLNRLIVMHDDNGISIDGPLTIADNVDQKMRFEACGWNATRIDGHDPEAILAALWRPPRRAIKSELHRLQDHHRLRRADSSAGTEQGPWRGAWERRRVAGAREKLGWTSPPFVIPDDILAEWRKAGVARSGPSGKPGTSQDRRA